MYGVVRNGFVAFISKNHRHRHRLLLNPNNNRKLTTSIASSTGTAAGQLPKSPPSPSQAGPGSGSGWIFDKLKTKPFKYWIFGSFASGSLVGSTAVFSLIYPVKEQEKIQFIEAVKAAQENIKFLETVKALEKGDSGIIVRLKPDSAFFMRPVKMAAEAKKEVDFEFDMDDLIDDKSFRKLYHRWLTHHGFTRQPEEKEAHFQTFKQNVYYLYFFNISHEHLSCRLGLTPLADMTKEEWKEWNPPVFPAFVFNDFHLFDPIAPRRIFPTRPV